MVVARRFGATLVGVLLSMHAVACGSGASLDFGAAPTTYADGGETVYPDGGGLVTETGVTTDGEPDVGEAPKCAPGTGGKANVCVRVLRGADSPSYNDDSKKLGLDGQGAILVGLSELKPARELSFVAQTWYPSESAGSGKLAVNTLPKVAEPLSVAPGTYYAFAVFRDIEPYVRNGVAIGDYIPRFVELKPITVTADAGFNVDVRVYPARAVDVELKMTATPSGSGAGPVSGWLLDDGKVVGEGSLPCADLREGKTATVRVFTTYTGSFDLAAALFDFTAPSADSTDLMPTLTPGTLHGVSSAPSAFVSGDWFASPTHLDLGKIEPLMGVKPADPSPACTTASYAPAK